MTHADGIVFLLDVDNTLFDNDRFQTNLMRHFAERFGSAKAEHYRVLIEELRAETGYVDYLGALQRFRLDDMDNMQLLSMSGYLMDYPFAELLYPAALDVIDYLGTWGKTVILSDGDVIFQPRKIRRSGLWKAVGGDVLIYVHKEKMLEAVAQHYPARHYVMVDDKLSILSTMKSVWKDKLTTVFPHQGHYAHSALGALDTKTKNRADHGNRSESYRSADIDVESIADLINQDFIAPLPVSNSNVAPFSLHAIARLS